MNSFGFSDRLSLAVAEYAARNGTRPVSIMRLVRATSYLMPEMHMSEPERAEIVAEKLVGLRCNIDFDMPVRDHKTSAWFPAQRA